MERVIKINERLLADSFNVTGLDSVDEVVQAGLVVLVKSRLGKQKMVREFRGAFSWRADPEFSNAVNAGQSKVIKAIQ